MGNRQDILEINGKLYDATTGKVLHDHAPKTPTHHAKSVDGFMPNKSHKLPKAHKVAAHAVHSRQAARSTTLMRKAVHKPKITAKAGHVADSHHIETYAERRHEEDLRFKRAVRVPTNKLVSRFGYVEPTDFKVEKKHTPLEVKQAPLPPAPPALEKAIDHAMPATNHFEKSLKNATAHTNKPLKKTKLHHRAAKKLHVKPKTLRVATASAAIVLLGGFIAYQNAAILAVRVAATRAGISASVPSYTPAGFKLQTHAAKPGQIIIGYKSTTDGRSFQLTQTASSWDSATLLQNVVASTDYQTVSSKGRKIYIYDNNATWVDNGIWFKLESKANLSSTQLQQLIDSI